MEHKNKLMLIIGLTASFSVLTILFLAIFICRRRKTGNLVTDTEAAFEFKEGDWVAKNADDLMKFQGGDGLTGHEIPDAPDGKSEAHRWSIICRIAVGIARGIYHLHTSLEKPVIHGNLKSENILLDQYYQPCVLDSGLLLLMNPSAAQQMVEVTAS